MRKRIVAFLCMMMVFTMTTGVAMAEQVYWSEQCDKNSYRDSKWGDASKFSVYGTSNLAYLTLENTSGSAKYLTCQMAEYTDNIGWTNSSSAAGLKPNGVQISTQIARNTDIAGYYYHGGYCYNDQSCSRVIDDYLYKAYQD